MDRMCGRWRLWVGIHYLSPFERSLNRALWALNLSALVYCVVEKVLLANVPEVFRGGARVGELVYDLAIAYVGAFVFYLLVVRLPLRQDRRNVWAHMGPLLERVPSSALGTIQMLNQVAGFSASRENSLASVREMCEKIGPQSPSLTLRFFPTSGEPLQYQSVIESMRERVAHARRVNQQILDQSAYLSTDIYALVNAVDQCAFITSMEMVGPMAAAGRLGNTDLTVFADDLFDYMVAAHNLDEFCQAFIAGRTANLSELAGGSGNREILVPLRRFVVTAN